ncbi:hypothetical protein [Neomicrococcus lactis]|uniref:Uncharacterized protein n=1 Tax=Neomicrococcus lactis TaxID=732241 RepID=A0A7W9DAG4_9MICC|nr:hypothetical protein [Neomicrococcus lactis]MBB5597633.1 hypothetical protein [Neomicrococcus lactis]
MGLFTQSVEVECTPAGQPLRVHWQGREYRLAAEPVRWFERRKWWAEDVRAERARGAGMVDHEIWRLQVRLVGRGPLQTLELSHHVETGRWRLIQVGDAALRQSA